MKKILCLCLCLASLVIAPVTLAAEVPAHEQISTFDSNILVNTDASINVTEKITVYAAGQTIKRGLVRTLPKAYRDSYGINRRNSYELQSVLVNGAKSPYHIRQDRKNFSIYVGHKDHYLAPGWYEYTFKYKVINAVNFLKDGDELYWNATGNDWKFPILQANAKVTLPPGVKMTYFRAYTGRVGEKGMSYTPEQLGPDIIVFTTTEPLPPGSGLTVAIAWPKGIVQQPGLIKRMNTHLDLNKGSYIVIELTIITLLYFLLVWEMYGQDPDKGPIFPRFAPPENITPMFARFLLRMGYDRKILTTALVWLASRGFISIHVDDDSVYTLKKVKEPKHPASEEEALLLSKLFTLGSTVTLKPENRSTVNKFKSALKKLLNENNLGYYFVTNTKFIFPGIALFLFAALTTVIYSNNPEEAGFSIIWLSVWTAGTYFLLYQAWASFKRAKRLGTLKSILATIGASIFAIPFLLGEVAGIYSLGQSIPIFTIPFLFLIAAMIAIFYILMKQPTVVGRKLMDEIEGFQMFLSTTEGYRLKSYEPPEMTEELYEKYLPYAIALDVENRWGERLDRMLAVAGKAPDAYQPRWYSGPRWTTSSPVAFSNAFSAGLGGALASTSVSSSASGGGGFSGGGGGGGGGGGW